MIEYKTEDCSSKYLEQGLNEMGEQGWQLVQVVTRSFNLFTALFSRTKTEAEPYNPNCVCGHPLLVHMDDRCQVWTPDGTQQKCGCHNFKHTSEPTNTPKTAKRQSNEECICGHTRERHVEDFILGGQPFLYCDTALCKCSRFKTKLPQPSNDDRIKQSSFVSLDGKSMDRVCWDAGMCTSHVYGNPCKCVVFPSTK